MDWLYGFIWTAIPLWVWIIAGGVLVGAAWRTFGLHGVLGGLLALLTLGAYRQGYRDADARKPPLVPVEDYERAIVESPKRKRKTLVDLFAEWGNR